MTGEDIESQGLHGRWLLKWCLCVHCQLHLWQNCRYLQRDVY